jgi:hypothetical protein
VPEVELPRSERIRKATIYLHDLVAQYRSDRYYDPTSAPALPDEVVHALRLFGPVLDETVRDADKARTGARPGEEATGELDMERLEAMEAHLATVRAKGDELEKAIRC